MAAKIAIFNVFMFWQKKLKNLLTNNSLKN